MNIAVGFGSTEQAFEAAEEATIREHIKARYSELALDYFTDEFVKEVTTWVTARSKALHAKAAEYKSATDHPSRYSTYWPSVVADASHIVVILSVHHINRRHAWSPDGWALLQTKPVFVVENSEMERGR
jgi:hypothetical protein